MKTERRHDLETNLLARKMAGWVNQIKPYSNAMGVVAVALVVALVGWFLLSRQSAGRESVAWNDYFFATLGRPIDPAKLQATAQQHSGSPVAHWANLAWADSQLQLGTQALFVNKPQARNNLQQAIDAYRLLETSSAPQLIRDRASYGLARAFESLGRVDDARRQYMTVQGTFAEMARARADSLDRTEIRQFYDWFANAEPPVPPMTGGLGIPGQRPIFGLEGDDILDSGLLPGFGLGLEGDSSDTEPPPADPEPPPADTEPPPAYPEMPPADPETPPADPETPPADTETPTADTESPSGEPQ